jgi:Protein of unknown function (DUF1592)/Protein of unknown function (DUF1588)/Protein of unknown function (DUF1595)/Protein of unknown function (DUF1587)/Protein of unknown function (DUF1585)
MMNKARARVPGMKLYSSFVCLGVLVGSACTGSVGGDGSPGPSGQGGASGGATGSNGGSGTGAAGSGNTTGAGKGTGATGGLMATSSLTPNASDVHLADPDPTTAPCAVGGEELVPFRSLTRLNRFEYDNTARDLLGDTTHAALSTLPTDYGDGAFDNNADALSIDPTLAQTYQQLAETLAENSMATTNTAGRALILVCTTTDAACVAKIATSFATRAWRRPATTTEVNNLVALYTATRNGGFSFENGVQMMVEGALMSPNFLFRPEIDPTVDSPSQHPISPYELATRLSYFLWGSMPDAALQAAAGAGQLGTRDAVLTQVKRMWADPKIDAFVTRFPGEWLHTLDVTVASTPDPKIFPQFNATLASAMPAETAAYMRDFVTGDVNFFDFIDAKYTYVNQTLAQFYGIAGQFGTQMTRVDLTGNTERGGILTQASVLAVTSVATRTSPVKRGQWVLSRLLDTPAPPPPDNVPPITDAVPADGLTFRQKMIAHVTNPVCAGCHDLMDPIGFGLESYDGIGQWRTIDNGLPVDSSGTLTTGQKFSGALELEKILKTDSRVPSAVVQYVMSYALGRSVNSASNTWAADQCAVSALATAFQTTDNNRMSAFISRIAGTDFMRARRAAP